jgi:hypothetical protein
MEKVYGGDMIGFVCACLLATQAAVLAERPKLNLDMPAGYEQAELQKLVSTPLNSYQSPLGSLAQNPLLHLGVQILMENATDDATSDPNPPDLNKPSTRTTIR